MNSFRHLNRFRADLKRCTACGMCVPPCPLHEMDCGPAETPRALAGLLLEVLEGRISETEARRPLQSCLMCGLCERHCPAALPLLEIFRAARHDLGPMHPGFSRRLMESLLSRPRLIKLAWQGATFAKSWRPHGSANKEATNRRAPRLPRGRENSKVLLFAGCLANFTRPGLLDASARVLNYHGIAWRLPDFTCCGAYAADAGRSADARALVVRNLRIFASSRATQIITLCPHCRKQIRKSWPSLAWLSEEERSLARQFAEKTCGIGEFLNRQDKTHSQAEWSGEFCWHQACVENKEEEKAILALLGRAGFRLANCLQGCCGNILATGAWPPLAAHSRNKVKARKPEAAPEPPSPRTRLARNLKREINIAKRNVASSCPGCIAREPSGKFQHWLELYAQICD